jgi:integrase/recombinase XerD
MDLGYLPKQKLDLMKADKDIKETYTDEELALLLKKPDIKKCSFAEYRNWVLVNYFLATGNRVSTVVNIRIGDIDFANGMISLTKTKNRKAQTVPLAQTMQRILQEYLAYRQGNADDFLFCSQYGKPFTRDGVQSAIHDFNTRRGVTKTSVHLFRHTFAKKWIMSGGDIFRLQKLLGHSSLDIVKEYVNIFGADLKEQYDTFNPLENVYRSQNLESKKALGMRKS